MIDDWIDKYHMLDRILREIVEECLNESMSEYILENMLNRLAAEGAEVVARGIHE